MLTAKQPATYGYKSVYDLPTPPPTSRLSPPGYHQDIYKQPYPSLSRSQSPSSQSMSNPHRGLPRSAAFHPVPAPAPHPQQHPLAGGPLPPSPSVHPPPTPHTVQHGHPSHLGPSQTQQQPPPPPPAPLPAVSQQQQQQQQQPPPSSSLPAPPSQWQGSEEPMKSWLHAKSEEERTKQEEQKTRQENIRLEQRKVEMDMLQTSLNNGVPPPMVPLVFAAMGNSGLLPQAMIDWAQQYLQNPQAHVGQMMQTQGLQSPEQTHQASVLSRVGSGTAPYIQYTGLPGSPSRQRGQAVPTAAGRSSEPGGGIWSGHQPQAQLQGPQIEASPSIDFHHWQPPTSQQPSSANMPGTPSGESSKKRKAAAPQPSGSQTRERPQPFIHTDMANPPSGKRVHKRQRSDVSWQKARERSPSDDEVSGRPTRATSPGKEGRQAARESYEPRKHSVSSMLSGNPGSAEPRAGPRREIRAPRHYGDEERDREHDHQRRTTPPARDGS